MKKFNDENFLLESPVAEILYHDYAAKMPILDYHCHLDVKDIAEDREFENLSKIWLEGDHYKWRAMRTNGVEERYCTGSETTDFEKFEKWAETVPFTMRNPLYHWTHLELKTAFGVNELLNPLSAKGIYEKCSNLLQTPSFSARGLLGLYNVEVVCTTDDPISSLEYHIKCRDENYGVKVLPTWRADKAMNIDDLASYKTYIDSLSEISNISIESFDTLIEALQKRHNFFESVGCRISDHGIEQFYAEKFTHKEVDAIFKRILQGEEPSQSDKLKFKSAMLYELAIMDWRSGWVQQFHYGVLRNNNSRMFGRLGADTGFDSIADFSTARAMANFFDTLDCDDKLAKTIIYNINSSDNDMVATMIGNFQDGSYGPSKMQFGSAWWFMDQKDGIEKHLNSLSNLGLLSRFVGMLTDSRSFLSYPRHEYFRRIVCNILATDIEKGLLPRSELEFIGKEIVEAVCYNNAKNYFKF